MEKCPDCGKQFKNKQALGAHRRGAHGYHGAAVARKVATNPDPVAQHRALPAPTASGQPRVTVRVGRHEMTPEEFDRLVDEMLVVRAALARAR